MTIVAGSAATPPPTDQRGPWVYVTSLGSAAPKRLAQLYRQRWRVEQAIDELLHGHDLDHLVSYRLHPNRVAIGLRLLARNLAIGYQIRRAGRRPTSIREPRAFRAEAVEGLGLFVVEQGIIALTPLQPPTQPHCAVPWTHQTLQYAA